MLKKKSNRLSRFGNTTGAEIPCEVSGLQNYIRTLMIDLRCISSLFSTTWLDGLCVCSLHIQKGNPVPKRSRAQKLAESWRTIKQLKSLNRKEYDEVN